jgi:hypothetical protein
LIGAFVVLVIVSAIAGGDDSSKDSNSNDTATQAAQTVSVKTVTQAAPAQPAPAQPAPEPTTTAAPPEAPPEQPEMTAGQENALKAAQDYIDLSGFSKAGLIEQLSSKAGEGFSRADATFAANHVGADWNAEAVEAAQDSTSRPSPGQR